MCGIAGIIALDNSKSINIDHEVRTLTELQRHRGPDGEGFFVQYPVALGHRRLSIIDLSTGSQPISNEDKSIWITFNGEIYNYISLRDELLACGHTFSTHSDTEVIVHGYEEWGRDVVKKLRGMFAFAIADLNNNKLFLARDHFGIKPLVYRKEAGFFAFASEINALKKVDGRLAQGNSQAVDTFLRYGFIPAPETIFVEVKKLLPGCFVEVSFTGEVKIDRYWDFSFVPDSKKSQLDWVELIEKSINESVAAHTVADVPYGVFLSGGVDSTLIASSLTKFLGYPSTAFCMDFSDQKYSELSFAKYASDKIGCHLVTGLLTEIAFEDLKKIVLQYGEPYGDSSCVPTWKISELVRKHVPLVLSGDGGDELFGGYTSTYESILALDPWFRLRSGISNWNFRKIGSGIKEILLGSRKDLFTRYIENLSKPHFGFRKMIFQDKWHSLTEVPCQAILDSAERCYKEPGFQSKVQKLDILNYMPNDILTKVDIATMAQGLEARPPLIDKYLYSVGLQVPSSFNIQSKRGYLNGKILLKAILSKYGFSESFVHRKKKGFTVPKKKWFANGGEANDFILDMLSDSRHRFHLFFKKDGVEKLLSIHNTEENQEKLLWYILVLGIWLESNREVDFK
jgi:asparagine synthase (glutamine-hydrolysing)